MLVLLVGPQLQRDQTAAAEASKDAEESAGYPCSHPGSGDDFGLSNGMAGRADDLDWSGGVEVNILVVFRHFVSSFGPELKLSDFNRLTVERDLPFGRMGPPLNKNTKTKSFN